MDAVRGTKLDTRGLIAYLAVAFGFTWLIDLVLFVTGQGITGPWALPAMVVSMLGPAIAAFVVARWISPTKNLVATTGLRLGVKGTRWGWYYLFAIFAMPALVVGALFVGAALGVYQMDLTNFSAYKAALEATPAGQQVLGQMPIATLVLVQLVSLPFAGLINIPATFGEEYGWRGYLLPALLPLGQWRALIVHGLIWGLWHAPVILMGYNYPLHPVIGIFAMMVFTTVLGILFGWLRLATGSVWPAVVAHAEVNAAGGTALLLGQHGAHIDTLNATLLGWSGWILPLVIIGVLVLLKQLPVRNAARTTPVPGEQAGQAAQSTSTATA